MLTKNFYAYMRGHMEAGSALFTLTDGTAEWCNFVNTVPPFVAMKSWAIKDDAYGVSFGTGTTPADASNYKLESILNTTQISVANPSAVSYSQFDTHDEHSVTFGVTNKTAEAITISEIGLTAIPYKGSSSSGITNYALVDRTVLDTPVTIPAGQSKQITYTIRFNYGDAV